MALVTKIKEYREQAGYKQSELAELLVRDEKQSFTLKMADIIRPLN